VLQLLVDDRPLPRWNRDHALSGDWPGYRDCHLWPDLLLIDAKPSPDVLRLLRLGSHSDLFD
jgi:mRNA interferase YafQ